MLIASIFLKYIKKRRKFKLINKYFFNLWNGICVYFLIELSGLNPVNLVEFFVFQKSTCIFLGWKIYFQY